MGVPISSLPAASALTGAELIPVVQSGQTKRTTTDAIPYVPAGTGAVTTTVQNKLRETVSVKDFGAVGDGVTDDTAEIQAAVAHCFATGAELYWPDGDYYKTASISNLHLVRHSGSGRIRLGATYFYIDPTESSSNTIYISPLGSDLNDGLTSGAAIKTVQAGFDILAKYGPVLSGNWKLQLAAGTYNSSSSIVGIRSEKAIVIAGPDVSHPTSPTAIIDGTGVLDNIGMYIQYYMNVRINDVKFSNWTYGTSYGLCVDGHCQVFLDNCHFYNCGYAGCTFDNLTQVRMLGGIVENCQYYGIRLYSQTSASIGYTGTGVGSSTIVRNCGTGIIARVSCRAHIDYADINNCTNYGLHLEMNSRGVANYCRFDSIGISAIAGFQNAVYGESGGGTNTFTNNATRYRYFSGAVDGTIVATPPQIGPYVYRETGTLSTQSLTPVTSHTFTIPGGYLSARGTGLDIHLFGECVGTAGTKTITVKIGGATVTTKTLLATSVNWNCRIKFVVRTNSSIQKAVIEWSESTAALATTTTLDVISTFAEDFSTDKNVVVEHSVENVADIDRVQHVDVRITH